MSVSYQDNVVLIVPRNLVKTFKTKLEEHDLLDKKQRIRHFRVGTDVAEFSDGENEVSWDEHHCIPTRSSRSCVHGQYESNKGSGGTRGDSVTALLQTIGMMEFRSKIGILSNYPTPGSNFVGPDVKSRNGNPQRENQVGQIIKIWKESTAAGEKSMDEAFESLRSRLPRSAHPVQSSDFAIYPPMLLLQPSFLKRLPDGTFRKETQDLLLLWRLLCYSLQVTYIALNGGIPQRHDTSLQDSNHDLQGVENSDVNILRSPSKFQPVHGDFGPVVPSDTKPESRHFNEAFWCSTVQHGITQTWAPRYTMLSRGNLSEKLRVRKVFEMSRSARHDPSGSMTAVDLYAGIGYFAFSYGTGGAEKVLCWEINGWSLEGLRRGAVSNKWQASTLESSIDDQEALRKLARSDEKFLIFPNSNEYAAPQIDAIRTLIPPIRHVNCGYLPSSEPSWRTAVKALDPFLGGWIHAHENMEKRKIEDRVPHILGAFSLLVAEERPDSGFSISCEHLEKVKSYSPGVMHCVLDVAILPDPP